MAVGHLFLGGGNGGGTLCKPLFLWLSQNACKKTLMLRESRSNCHCHLYATLMKHFLPPQRRSSRSRAPQRRRWCRFRGSKAFEGKFGQLNGTLTQWGLRPHEIILFLNLRGLFWVRYHHQLTRSVPCSCHNLSLTIKHLQSTFSHDHPWTHIICSSVFQANASEHSSALRNVWR